MRSVIFNLCFLLLLLVADISYSQSRIFLSASGSASGSASASATITNPQKDGCGLSYDPDSCILSIQNGDQSAYYLQKILPDSLSNSLGQKVAVVCNIKDSVHKQYRFYETIDLKFGVTVDFKAKGRYKNDSNMVIIMHYY
ncbi:MAG: hypothetical protein WCL18_09500 [bacterium]